MNSIMSMYDFNWLTPALAIGGAIPEEYAERLVREHRIGHVVDLRSERCDDRRVLLAHGIELLHLPTPDLRPVTQPMLWAGVAWIWDAQRAGDRVLVHCQHGIGRSALLALCVLVAEGRSPLSALSLATRIRPKVCPSPEQLQALLDWAALWTRRPDAGSWDELASIAYGPRERPGDRPKIG